MAVNPHYPKLYEWARYKAFVSDWDAVTRVHEYEDGVRTFNELADYGPKRWELVFTGISIADREVFDAHFEEKRKSRTFNFIDKDGVLHPDTYYESYESNHEGHQSWINTIRITLIQFSDANESFTGTAVEYGAVAVQYGAVAVNY